MSHREFVGKYNPDELPELSKRVGDLNHKENEPYPGEQEKTPEQMEMITKALEYVMQDAKRLGVEIQVIDPDRIHLLSGKIFEEQLDSKQMGFYDDHLGAFFINLDKFTKAGLIHAIIHEVVHASSKHKIFVHENGDFDTYRVGYHVYNPHEPRHDHFAGLNEAVVDLTAEMLIYNNRKDLFDRFNIKKKDSDAFHGYGPEKHILRSIMSRIAEEEKMDDKEVWSMFRKSQYTGELMFLRKIEKIYGKGALRVLSRLGDEKVSVHDIFNFFETDDMSEREQLLLKINKNE